MLDPIFIYVVSIPVYIILFIIYLKRKEKFTTILFSSLFYFYIVAVIGVTLFPLPITQEFIEWRKGLSPLENNFIPFTFLSESIARLSYNPNIPFDYFDYAMAIVLRQVGGNILLGMPFGFLAPLVWKKRNTFLKVLVAGFWFSFAIEASQFLISLWLGYTYRITDVDDIILNCTGCMMGYLIYKACVPLYHFIMKSVFTRPSQKSL
jgi:glycopeptide antibiotics resistance protein